MIITSTPLHELEIKDAPMGWHLRGQTYTATGSGRRIPTRTMVKLPGANRWRRVYCCYFSSIGTCYVEVTGGWHVIH